MVTKFEVLVNPAAALKLQNVKFNDISPFVTYLDN